MRALSSPLSPSARRALEWRGPEDFADAARGPATARRGRANPVQVMTIHRAKGLQFDHVIVPALERATRGTERRLLRWIDLPSETTESDLLISPSPAGRCAAEESDLNAFVKQLIRQRDMHERGRLLYVAATRARSTLWLSARPGRRRRRQRESRPAQPARHPLAGARRSLRHA